MFCATSSLPVPFSPVIKIQALLEATRAIICLRLTITGLSPINAIFLRSFESSAFFSVCSRLKLRMLAIKIVILSIDNGFSTKSQAPFFTARTAVSIVPWPDMMMNWQSG